VGDLLSEYWWVVGGILLAAFWSVRLATHRIQCPRCGAQFKGFRIGCPGCGVHLAHSSVAGQVRVAKIILVAVVLAFLYVIYVYMVDR
jgi:predicted amidophosphoribosyltransferase